MKIVSLVPSITESLLELGATEVVGRTKFCIHPDHLVQDIPIVGGTKKIHLEKIETLRPEVIIANKEENNKEQIETLMKKYKVWLTDIKTLDDNYEFILNLSSLIRQPEKGKDFCLKILENFDGLSLKHPIKTAYLIWKQPYMTVGGDTFINDILTQLGFDNIFKHQARYPSIEIEDLAEADLIFLSTEPFPFKETHLQELKNAYPNKRFKIVDGEAFSWYGTHLAKCGSYYRQLLAELS